MLFRCTLVFVYATSVTATPTRIPTPTPVARPGRSSRRSRSNRSKSEVGSGWVGVAGWLAGCLAAGYWLQVLLLPLHLLLLTLLLLTLLLLLLLLMLRLLLLHRILSPGAARWVAQGWVHQKLQVRRSARVWIGARWVGLEDA